MHPVCSHLFTAFSRNCSGCRISLIFLTAFLLSAGLAIGSDPAHELRACWLTNYYYESKTEAELKAAARDMKEHGINTVYVAVYASMKPLWPSDACKAAGGAPSQKDWPAILIPIFKSQGLCVGAWFEYGMMVGYADHAIAKAHPDWLQVQENGDPKSEENRSATTKEGMVFLSPGSEPAMKLLEDMVAELASRYDFDDIQLDRFRWTRASQDGREFGYEKATAEKYKARTGKNPPSDKNAVDWVAFREELVNQAVRRCYQRIKSIKPAVVVSTAPVGSYGVRQHMQRWQTWLEQGYMDLVIPQIYITPGEMAASPLVFQMELEKHLRMAGTHRDQLAVGLRAMEADDAPSVENQIRHARSRGVYGACLWVYHIYRDNTVAIRDELDLLSKPGHVWEQPARNPYVPAADYFYLSASPYEPVNQSGVAKSEVKTAQKGLATKEGLKFHARLLPKTPIPCILALSHPSGKVMIPVSESNRTPDGGYLVDEAVHVFDNRPVAGTWTVQMRASGPNPKIDTLEAWSISGPLAAAPGTSRMEASAGAVLAPNADFRSETYYSSVSGAPPMRADSSTSASSFTSSGAPSVVAAETKYE